VVADVGKEHVVAVIVVVVILAEERTAEKEQASPRSKSQMGSRGKGWRHEGEREAGGCLRQWERGKAAKGGGWVVG